MVIRAYKTKSFAQVRQHFGYKFDNLHENNIFVIPIGRYVDKSKYVVQVWTDGKNELISYLLANQYRMILSNWDAWYLDCGFDAWVWNGVRQENNWCSPFKGTSVFTKLNNALNAEDKQFFLQDGRLST